MTNLKQKIINNLFNFFITYFWALAIFIVVVLSTVLYFFILAPKFDLMKAAFLSNREKSAQALNEKKTVLKTLKVEKKKMESIDNYDLYRLNTILPKPKDAITMTQAISALVEKAGFVVGGLTYSELENDTTLPDGVKKFNVSLTVTGADYVKFKSFLKVLASNAYLMDVVSIGFSGSSYRMDLNTYYR